MSDSNTSHVVGPGLSLADSHVHLDRFLDSDVQAMVRRAADAGVDRMLSVGVDLESSRSAIRLAERVPTVDAAVGLHPNRVGTIEDVDGALAELATLAENPKVVAVGEVGLDADVPSATVRQQSDVLIRCVRLAQAARLPLVLHVVGAHDQALRLLEPYGPLQAVVHYFVGDDRLAERYLAVGCLISVGKPVTRPRNAALRAAVARLPLERLLLETDTYPLPGRRTEPADLRSVCEAIATLRATDPATIAEVTTANYTRLFGTRGRGTAERSVECR